ncbi:MAG TPA: hypothetical protein PKX39_12860, partial [Flavobacteriales bacterium]|nr:hypothetical protein [Flavobacteriales bacterium]
ENRTINQRVVPSTAGSVLAAINGLFQVTRRRARGCTGFSTIRTVIFLIAGELDFTTINPYCR